MAENLSENARKYYEILKSRVEQAKNKEEREDNFKKLLYSYNDNNKVKELKKVEINNELDSNKIKEVVEAKKSFVPIKKYYFTKYNKYIKARVGLTSSLVLSCLIDKYNLFKRNMFYYQEKRIADELGFSTKTISRALQKLQELNYIMITRQCTPYRNFYSININELNEVLENGNREIERKRAEYKQKKQEYNSINDLLADNYNKSEKENLNYNETTTKEEIEDLEKWEEVEETETIKAKATIEVDNNLKEELKRIEESRNGNYKPNLLDLRNEYIQILSSELRFNEKEIEDALVIFDKQHGIITEENTSNTNNITTNNNSNNSDNSNNNNNSNNYNNDNKYITYEYLIEEYNKANVFSFDVDYFWNYWKDKGLLKNQLSSKMISWNINYENKQKQQQQHYNNYKSNNGYNNSNHNYNNRNNTETNEIEEMEYKQDNDRELREPIKTDMKIVYQIINNSNINLDNFKRDYNKWRDKAEIGFNHDTTEMWRELKRNYGDNIEELLDAWKYKKKCNEKEKK